MSSGRRLAAMGGWDVAALLAHVCPDPAMFDRLDAALVDDSAPVTDAEVLTPDAR